MFKKVKPVVFIIWGHLFVFSLFLLLSDFGGDSFEFIPEGAKVKQNFYSPDSLMNIKLFETVGEANIYSITYKFMNQNDKPLMRVITLPKVDSVKVSSEKCYIYTGKIAFEEFSLAAMVRGNIEPVYYDNGTPGKPSASWFSFGKIGGIICLLLSMIMMYVIIIESKRE